MRGVGKLVVVAALSPWAVACGETGSAPTDAAAADTSVGSSDAISEPPADAGTESTADVSAQADAPSDGGCPVCPASPPEAGAPCSTFGLDELGCEYGDDPRLVNVFAQCLSGQWFSPPPTFALADSGLPIQDAGCPPTFAAAEIAGSCDTPSCVYPEGTCTCDVDPTPNRGQDAATFWACTSPPLAAGCPASIAAAQSGATCPSNALRCFYPGGTCTCFVSDAGPPWQCTVPLAGCPTTRPRIGTACDPALAPECKYIPVGCTEPTGDLFCRVPPGSSCAGVWVSGPGALCPK